MAIKPCVNVQERLNFTGIVSMQAVRMISCTVNGEVCIELFSFVYQLID